jgi:fructokinase
MAVILKQDLEAFGVDIEHLISQAEVSTRRIGHLISVEGRNRGMHRFSMQCFNCKRHFPKSPSVNQMNAGSSIYDRIGAETLLILDRANAFTLELARRTASKKGLVMFEPGHLPRENNIIGELMAYVDILKYSEELRRGGYPLEETICIRWPRLRLIVETRGAEGVKVSVPRRNSEIRLNTTYRTQDMTISDLSGAGDAFTAGFLSNLGPRGIRDVDGLDNMRLEEAINYGQAMGALACLFYGSNGLLYAKTREEIKRAVKSVIRARKLPTDFDALPRMRRKKFRNSRSNVCKICWLGSR